MSKFDFMNFEGGMDTNFVAHANKFTKGEVIARCILENDWRFQGGNALRTPTIDDVHERHVKYFVKCPYYCGFDTDNGCYTYCEESARGSFPVFSINFEDLRFS